MKVKLPLSITPVSTADNPQEPWSDAVVPPIDRGEFQPQDTLEESFTSGPSYGVISDGTNTADADHGGDQLTVRSSDGSIIIAVTDEDATHGDNVDLKVNPSLIVDVSDLTIQVAANSTDIANLEAADAAQDAILANAMLHDGTEWQGGGRLLQNLLPGVDPTDAVTMSQLGGAVTIPDGSIDEEHLANGAVTLEKMQDVTGLMILGRQTAGLGPAEEILAPGDTNKFLRADTTWQYAAYYDAGQPNNHWIPKFDGATGKVKASLAKITDVGIMSGFQRLELVRTVSAPGGGGVGCYDGVVNINEGFTGNGRGFNLELIADSAVGGGNTAAIVRLTDYIPKGLVEEPGSEPESDDRICYNAEVQDHTGYESAGIVGPPALPASGGGKGFDAKYETSGLDTATARYCFKAKSRNAAWPWAHEASPGVANVYTERVAGVSHASLVTHGGKTYRCKTTHTATASFDGTKWDKTSDSDVAEVAAGYIVTNSPGSDEPFSRVIASFRSFPRPPAGSISHSLWSEDISVSDIYIRSDPSVAFVDALSETTTAKIRIGRNNTLASNLAQIDFVGKNSSTGSADANVVYHRITSAVGTMTAGVEVSTLTFGGRDGTGSIVDQFEIRNGIRLGGTVTGGFKGTGTINAIEYYRNGSVVTMLTADEHTAMTRRIADLEHRILALELAMSVMRDG